MSKVEIISLEQKKIDQARDESKLSPTERLEAAFQLIDLMRKLSKPGAIDYPEDEHTWITLQYVDPSTAKKCSTKN